MSDKKQQTLGWNANYFGEPKEGSLAKTIADITSKQNNFNVTWSKRSKKL